MTVPPFAPSLTAAPAIEVRELRVDYGNFVAVDDLTLAIPRGEVFGLVGPNGAGKTSTFRVLATLMNPTYGEVRVAGIDIFERPGAARSVMGYMPDLAPVPSDLKVWEFLDLFADAHRLGAAARRRERIDECLAEVRLTEQRNAFCKTLSRGQTQRLVLAKTLLHQPQVLILDEPASGMDPLSRRNLRRALRALADQGTTVFISSHILSELAEMCSSLCVMDKGRLLAAGTVEEVRRVLGHAERTLTVTVLDAPDAAAACLARQPAVTGMTVNRDRLVFQFSGSQEEQAGLLTALVHQQVRVAAFEEHKSTFEEILVQVADNDSSS
ncbi:MAG: ATP-binding cassette domain-containing protein [Verrucomicrobiales bacterium]